MTERSDAAVVRAVLDGEADAFNELVHRYQDQLYRHAERMTGEPDVAADIVQAAFVKGFQNLGRCRDPERVGAWLFRIASNRCKDHLKSRRRRNFRLDDARRLPADGGNPEETAERAQVRVRVHSALQRLPTEQREAFVLKHVEGLSYPEIAERLDESISALKMRVHRAREALQTLLEEYR